MKAEEVGYDIAKDEVVQPGDEATERTAPIVDGRAFAEHHKATLGKETVPEEDISTQSSPIPTALLAIAVLLILAAIAWSMFHDDGSKPAS